MTKPGRRRTIATSIVAVIVVLVTGTLLNVGRRLDAGIIEKKHGRRVLHPPGGPARRQTRPADPVGAHGGRTARLARLARDLSLAGPGRRRHPGLGNRGRPRWGGPGRRPHGRGLGTSDHRAGQNCAPSRELDPFFTIEGLHELLAAGYVIAATDYPGMGIAGPSSYLLGVPESNSVLDSARAARNIPAARASTRVVLWGHSQAARPRSSRRSGRRATRPT
ncbi:MAG: lipase family protein [Galbitalea sp.]